MCWLASIFIWFITITPGRRFQAYSLWSRRLLKREQDQHRETQILFVSSGLVGALRHAIGSQAGQMTKFGLWSGTHRGVSAIKAPAPRRNLVCKPVSVDYFRLTLRRELRYKEANADTRFVWPELGPVNQGTVQWFCLRCLTLWHDRFDWRRRESGLEILCPAWPADWPVALRRGRKHLPSLHCDGQERMDCSQLTAVSWWTEEEWARGWVGQWVVRVYFFLLLLCFGLIYWLLYLLNFKFVLTLWIILKCGIRTWNMTVLPPHLSSYKTAFIFFNHKLFTL